MTIKPGEKIPDVILKNLTDGGMEDISTSAFFAGKKVVMFAVPGAFTPTCSARHLPGYVAQLAAFKALGCKIACLSVNDPFVMKAWAEAGHAGDIAMLADGNATFTIALGLDMDGSGYGMGTRSKRAALYAEDGTVMHIAVEEPGKFEGSSAEAMLEVVNRAKAAA